MTRSLAIRITATILALALALAAGIVIPTVARAALASNDWLGHRAYAATLTGATSRCALGAARAVDGGASVWAAMTGDASLDIVQIGARILPGGRRQFFAAWGRGEPFGAGSAYTEADLGPADTWLHTYTVALVGPEWRLSIDGRVRLRVPDTFRTWSIRAATVAHETESAADPFGGTWLRPAECRASRAFSGVWFTPTWHLFGSGPKAMAARCTFGADWFRAWRA